MAECLITKLKSIVDNENLLKLGELRVKAAGTIAIESPSSETTLKCINGTFEDGTTEKTVIGYNSFSNMTDPSIVSIIPKYNLTSISGWNGLYINLKDLKYCNNLIKVGIINAIEGSFKDVNEWIAAPNITKFIIYITTGFKESKLEDLNNFKAIKILELRGIINKITLNLENLSNLFPNLTSLKLQSINIVGNINELILPSTCKSCIMKYIPATLIGSKATFLANNPQVTTVDFTGSNGITD